MIKIACAGFPVGKKKYEAVLKTVELDDFFERFPKMETIEKWRSEAPPHFDFIVCAPRLITHPSKSRAQHSRAASKHRTPLQDTPAVRQSYATTLKIAEKLNARLVFFQLPPQFGPTPDNIGRVQSFFSQERGHILFTWEPPPTWPTKIVERISEAHRIMPVMNPIGPVKPISDPYMRYYRLGANGKTSGVASFTDVELKKIITMCDTPLSYVVFNNGPTAFKDAERMVGMLDPKRLP